ncbi:rapid alkalinization factor-domain-containing protein [Fusarium oxysporum f. sp. albedinis]|nr:rapid alkalinization factor-domain-containing protein [Fusarium oxysporum f. sp. albedinis]
MKFSIITLSLITLASAAPAAKPQSGEISYGALNRDHIPCSVKGASAANCRPGAEANPYNRGCNAIEKCRGGVGDNRGSIKFGYWNGLVTGS